MVWWQPPLPSHPAGQTSKSTVAGLVIKNTGNSYLVLTDSGETVECKIKGNFRLKGIKTTNPVAVGDHVEITEPAAGAMSYITEIKERKNYIIRRASNLSKQYHIIGANLDQTVLIITISHPATSTVFIDRFLATAEAYKVKAIVVINKTDLYDEDEKRFMGGLVRLYESIGYECKCISAATGEGIDDLQNMLAGKTTLFSGHSVVGKSSLINMLIPDAGIRTAELSECHDMGMHTTTFSEMHRLPEGGYIIDTPGIKGFGTVDMEDANIGHYFPEIFRFSKDCKYYNCTHRNEPGCAVKKAVEEHYISQSRYASYLGIFEDKNESKYR